MTLSNIDSYFVSQTKVGTQSQVTTGKIVLARSIKTDINDYANLMVSSHIAVGQSLEQILQKKAIKPIDASLLINAYQAFYNVLEDTNIIEFAGIYIYEQVKYQQGNVALYQLQIAQGSDADLIQFAKQTLPKILDHQQLILKLADKYQVSI